MTKRTEKAARHFFEALGLENWEYTHHPAKSLILCAFEARQKDWNRTPIDRWDWPYAVMRGDGVFDGDEPWTVLLRRAVELSRTIRP